MSFELRVGLNYCVYMSVCSPMLTYACCTCSSEDVENKNDVDQVEAVAENLEGPLLLHTKRREWLPFFLEQYSPDFTSNHIWVTLYERPCRRLFAPNGPDAANSTLLSGIGISEIVPEQWNLYEEYGLDTSPPYRDGTALHVRICARVSNNQQTEARFHRECAWWH